MKEAGSVLSTTMKTSRSGTVRGWRGWALGRSPSCVTRLHRGGPVFHLRSRHHSGNHPIQGGKDQMSWGVDRVLQSPWLLSHN